MNNFKSEKRQWENIILLGFGLVLVPAGAACVLCEHLQQGITLSGMGFFCLIFSFLSKFKRFKGFGIEAELWEDKQEEADELIKAIQKNIQSLRKVAIVVSECSMTSIVASGRLGGGIPDEYKLSLIEDVENSLSGIGLGQDEVERAKSHVLKLFLYDISIFVKKKILHFVNEELNKVNKAIKDLPGNQENAEKIRTLNERRVFLLQERSRLREKSGLEEITGDIISHLRDFVGSSKSIPDEVREKLKDELEDYFIDMEFLLKNKRLRRPDIYVLME